MGRPKGSLNKKTLEGPAVNAMPTEQRIKILANYLLDAALDSIKHEQECKGCDKAYLHTPV